MTAHGHSMDPAYYERAEDGPGGTCTHCNEWMPEQVEGEWVCEPCWKASEATE